MDQAAPGELTERLRAWRAGEPGARDAVFALVYDELRAIAARRLARFSGAIDTTELVNEAVLRLLAPAATAQDRQHFFKLAATAIRYTLIDLARRNSAEKRGQGELAITLSRAHDLAAPQSDWMEIERALAKLEALDPRKCRVLELAYLIGLDQREIADTLGLSITTIERDLRFARSWLQAELSHDT